MVRERVKSNPDFATDQLSEWTIAGLNQEYTPQRNSEECGE